MGVSYCFFGHQKPFFCDEPAGIAPLGHFTVPRFMTHTHTRTPSHCVYHKSVSNPICYTHRYVYSIHITSYNDISIQSLLWWQTKRPQTFGGPILYEQTLLRVSMNLHTPQRGHKKSECRSHSSGSLGELEGLEKPGYRLEKSTGGLPQFTEQTSCSFSPPYFFIFSTSVCHRHLKV